MHTETKHARKGLGTPEALTVVAVLGILFAIGYGVCRGARLSARLALAEGNLRSVDVALNLFFNKFGCYPPQGANLVAVLAPYLRDTNVFRNPLADEETLGQTLNLLYREPNLQELDAPGRYITAFVSDDGTYAVVLKSGGKVERLRDLSLPNDPAGRVAVLSGASPPQPEPAAQPQPAETPPPEPGTGDISGGLSLNPSNNEDFEFDLLKPDGTKITRDDLHASRGSLVYTGPAVRILFKPKGNGNQNTLTLNGQVYHLDNANRYLIVTLPGGSMTVNLYNAKAGKGRAMGRWWIAINATGAKIAICNCQGECTCAQSSP